MDGVDRGNQAGILSLSHVVTGTLGAGPATPNTNVDVPSAEKASRAGLWERDGAQVLEREMGVCAKKHKASPRSLAKRVSWRQKSRWGSSSPRAAAGNSGHPSQVTFPSQLGSPSTFPKASPGTGGTRGTPRASQAKGNFPEYLLIN